MAGLAIDAKYEPPKYSGLNRNPLHFVQADFISAPVVEPSGPGAGMTSHPLSHFDTTAVLEVVGDPGGAEGVAPDFRFDAGRPGAAPDHPIRINPRHGLVRELACLADG